MKQTALVWPLSKRDAGTSGLHIGGVYEEVRFGVTVRCGRGGHATGACSQGRRSQTLRQGSDGLRVRQASRRDVPMLRKKAEGKVRLFGRDAELQVSLRKRSLPAAASSRATE